MPEEDLVQVTVRIPRPLWKRAKLAAVKADQDLRDVVMEALEVLLAQRRKGGRRAR